MNYFYLAYLCTLVVALSGCSGAISFPSLAQKSVVRFAAGTSAETEFTSNLTEFSALRIPTCRYRCSFRGRDFEYVTPEYVIGSICVSNSDGPFDGRQEEAEDNARYGTRHDCYRSAEEVCRMANPEAIPKDHSVEYSPGEVIALPTTGFCDLSAVNQSIFTHFDSSESYGEHLCNSPDVNDDSNVDAADAGSLFSDFGKTGDGDLNCDNTIDAADFSILFKFWSAN